MRLRVIIFGLFVGLGGLGFGSLLLYVVWETRPSVVATMRLTMTDLAQMLAEQFEERLQSIEGGEIDPVEWIESEVARLGPNEGALGFLSVSEKLFEERFGEAILLYSPSGEKNLTYGSGQERVLVEKDELVVLYPIYFEGALIGFVGVTRGLDFARVVIKGSRWKIAGFGATIGVVTLIASWWLSRRLTRSLERLANYATAVKEGGAPVFKPSKSIEIEQLAESLESMRKALDGKDYIEQYTQSLAHALKAPLAGVRASSELLLENPSEEDRQRFLDHICQESQRMNSIVEKLIRLASLESGSVRMERAATEVGLLARSRADSFEWARESRGISIVFDIEFAKAMVDPFWLGEAITELLGNAIDFSADGGAVKVRVFARDAFIEIEVQDEGPGIPNWALTRISERFYSLPHASTGRKGTGLGLAFVKEVSKLHGGDFLIQNRKLKGVSARIRLPKV